MRRWRPTRLRRFSSAGSPSPDDGDGVLRTSRAPAAPLRSGPPLRRDATSGLTHRAARSSVISHDFSMATGRAEGIPATRDLSPAPGRNPTTCPLRGGGPAGPRAPRAVERAGVGHQAPADRSQRRAGGWICGGAVGEPPESFDHDHVVAGRTARVDAIPEAIEATDGWITILGTIVLGSLGGIETGARQDIRMRLFEVTEVQLPSSERVRVRSADEVPEHRCDRAPEPGTRRPDVVALADRSGVERSWTGGRDASIRTDATRGSSVTPSMQVPDRRARASASTPLQGRRGAGCSRSPHHPSAVGTSFPRRAEAR